MRYRSLLACVLGWALLASSAQSQTAPAAEPAPQAGGASESPRVLLLADQETSLVAETVGRVAKLGGGLGETFRAGDLLVSFDCAEQQAKLRIAQAELQSATKNLEAKQRLNDLRAAGEIEVSIARAAVEKANAQVELGRVQTSQCRVRAPFAGRIAKLHVRAYQGVNVGQALMDIVATGPLKLRLNVPSRWLTWLKVGQQFDVRIDETGKQYPASVAALNSRVDAVSQSIEIEARIVGNHQELLPGMSGTASFRQGK